MPDSRPPATFGASADAFLASLRARRGSTSSSPAIHSSLFSPAPTVACGTSSAIPGASGLSTPSHPRPTINASAAAFLASLPLSGTSFIPSTKIPARIAPSAPVSTSSSAATTSATVPPVGLPRHGFYFDLADGYDLIFESKGHFKAWLLEHRRANGVEFRSRRREFSSLAADKRAWISRETFTCTRDGDSRTKERRRKRPKQKSKAFHKELAEGCSATITVKTYPGTERVLAKHRDTHTHPLGAENLPYMTLSKEVHREIERQVAQGKSRKDIHDSLHDPGLQKTQFGVLNVVDRDKQVKLSDIGRIERDMKAEKFIFHPDEDISVLL